MRSFVPNQRMRRGESAQRMQWRGSNGARQVKAGTRAMTRKDEMKEDQDHKAWREERAVKALMKPGTTSHEPTIARRKQRTKTKVLGGTKGGTTTIRVDPEKLRALMNDPATKRDVNRNTRYAPPIINHRLCR